MAQFTTNDFTMHYEIHGEGSPVICIMGITAPGQVWQDHVEVWKQHFQCITPDNRGVGLTDKPEGDYSSELLAGDYANLMDHLGIQKAHVIGCSMGSVVAQQLGIKHADRVKSLTLMCTWARCDQYSKSVFSHILRAKARLKEEEFMEYIQLLIFAKKSWDDPEFYKGLLSGREDARNNPFPQPYQALVGQCQVCTEHNSIDQLRNIIAPTLVIGGEDDIFTPKWMSEEVHQGITSSELHLYPSSGHAFHWENLDDFNSRVMNHIQAND